MALFTEVIVILFILRRVLSIILEIINISYQRKIGPFVPATLSQVIDKSTLEKSLSYLGLKSRFGIFRSVFYDILVFIFIFTPLLNMYNSKIIGLNINNFMEGLIYFAILSTVIQILDIPFSLYDTFFIENKFGFNQMNISLWVSDFIKSFLIKTLLISGAVLAVIYITGISPIFWWVISWLFFFVLSITLMYISPFVIEPLFNKFTPLGIIELEVRIKALFLKVGIQASRVLKVDASKRSMHSNAYFTGIGRVKRIIIFDTLLEKLSGDEILSVLAHEAGHWKKKHIIKAIISYELFSLALFYCCFLIFRTDILPGIFQISESGLFVKIILALFIGSLLSFFLSPLVSYISRRRESEADRFAVTLAGEEAFLQSSLIKLSKDNLSNLYPHPLYVFFYYSHPPLVERLKKLSIFGMELKK